MKKNSAFTLIEVMVVLSILAIIAILAYNFFGSTMKEGKLTQASVQYFEGFRVISDAVEKYYLDTGALPVNAAALVSSGTLKALPTPPTGTYGGGSTDFGYIPGYDDMDSVGASDDTIYFDGVNEDVCLEFSKRYGVGPDSGAGTGAIWDYAGNTNTYPGSANRANRVYAISWGTAGKCELDWVMQYND